MQSLKTIFQIKNNKTPNELNLVLVGFCYLPIQLQCARSGVDGEQPGEGDKHLAVERGQTYQA